MLIDVSGDSTIGVGNVGIGPSYAAIVPPNAGHIAVANQGDSSVTLISTSAIGGGLTAPTTVTLSPQLNPAYLTSNESNVVYVANLGNTASATPPPSVAVISTLSNTVTNVINFNPIVSNSLMSLVETPDARKVYVASELANPLSGAVNVINVVDKSSATISDPTGILNSPVLAAARSDSARVYVLNQGNGNIAVIDSSTSPTADTLLPGTVSVGPGADFMFYDSRLNRLYVTNSALGTLTILDATVDPPNRLTTLSLPAGANLSCAVGCASVAALPDGTRAYVTTLQQSGGNVSALITAINTSNNTIVGSTSLPATPVVTNCAGTRFRLSTAAAGDSTRVYVANCDAGNVMAFRTSDNSLISLPAPVSASQPVKATISAASQNGSQTTFTYSLPPGSSLQVGMSIVVTGMTDSTNNGSFIIATLGPTTFTVLNPAGVNAGGQNGVGTATVLQNPVFVMTGP